MVRAVMIQGAGSNVGKSMLVAGLARLFARQGLRVRPFKPQNMSNNAAVADGGEIGRAQALQARACGVRPSVHMNPVLLKPESETGSQVIVQGKLWTTARARDYAALKPRLMAPVLDSFAQMSAEADLVLIEGAGSPAEVNLRVGDIANMGFARAAGVPVVLVGDIDRGGVIAQLVGTQAVIDPADAAMIRGFLINKFRGDPRLFDDGYAFVAERTGWPGFGVVPWFADAHRLPAEDALDLHGTRGTGPFLIAVPHLSRIANFDDLDPLAQEPGVRLVMVAPGQPIPVEAGLIILPGSKATIADLAFLRAQGWDIDIAAALRRGARVLGLCGGYQMLGRTVSDPGGIEGPPASVAGLGLLEVDTVMTDDKRVTETAALHLGSGLAVHGYEIHIGRTKGPDAARPMFTTEGQPEGATSADGRVMGSYLHGMFSADPFRRAFLTGLGATAGTASYEAGVDATLDLLADHLEVHVDCAGLLALAGQGV
ncbi:MAG: cobyric acid synthase [Pseudotabrizicola sp.]|uniref:cobyric acid synthase n=1 Tax=Pseudotabrizicola sp. TaxID=2939647 RepID=UPI00272163E8|nr:cobyric acid synthase [Pseudotabrizicola sp.]MDO9638443.1 cobyric acid synthase [Pseudotabrizicola sp.]